MLKLYVALQCVRGHLRCLRADRRGITALEYGILAVIVVAAVGVLGTQFNGLFTNVFSRVNSAVSAR